MAKKKLKLTWQKGTNGRSGRWRKMIKGQTFYFDGGNGKSDRKAYQVAVEECEKLRVEILSKSEKPNAEDYKLAIDEWEAALDWCEKNKEDLELAEVAASKIKELRRRLSGPRPRVLDERDQLLTWMFQRTPTSSTSHQLPKPKSDSRPEVFVLPATTKKQRREMLHELAMYPDDKKKMLWEDRIASYMSEKLPPDKTIEGSVERYLEHHKARAESGAISPSRYGNIRRGAESFRDFVGGGKDFTAIDEPILRRYYTSVRDSIAKGDTTASSARDTASDANQYIRWLWKEGAIEQLPRNLGDSEIVVPSKEVRVFEIEEIKTLWKSANERMRLFILLALNCGMTQKDISDLKPAEVDWKLGTIKRKRSKTQNHESTPTITYTLWPETLKLLKKFRVKNNKTNVLLNKNGTAYRTERINAKGNPIKVDIIGKDFNKLKKACNINDRSFINLKKTSRSLLEDNKEFQAVAELLVGRAPRTVSERHYAKPATNWLAEATAWLRESLEIEKLAKIKTTI